MSRFLLSHSCKCFLKHNLIVRLPFQRISRLLNTSISSNVFYNRCNIERQLKSNKLTTMRRYSSEALSIEMVSDRVMLILRLYDKIDPQKITLDSHLMNDMGIDSLDHVEVIMAIEEEFAFEIPDQEAIKLNTPREIIQYVCDKYDVYD